MGDIEADLQRIGEHLLRLVGNPSHVQPDRVVTGVKDPHQRRARGADARERVPRLAARQLKGGTVARFTERAFLIRRPAYTVPAGVLVVLFAFVACSPPPEPPTDGDGGAEPIACDPACDTNIEACNAATGTCELLDSAPQASLLAVHAGGHGEVDAPLVGVTVTYALTAEPAASGVNGFFVQAQQQGPALFIAVDPATLNPMPQAGDKVSLRVTQMQNMHGVVEAKAVADYRRLSAGHDLAPLVQDVSMRSDLVADAVEFDGELVDIAGRVRHDWLPLAGGAGHFKAELELLNMFGDPNLILRTNETVTRPMGLGTNCHIALTKVPLRRSSLQVQIFAFRNEDFTQRNCPPTRLEKALAISPTHVRLTFERPIDPDTILPDGSQFDFGGGLVGTQATVLPTGNQLLVTTGVQTPRAMHAVTIAGTARDLVGGALSVPAAKAGFQGYFTRAQLLINEINCARPNDRDLIELYALTAGSTLGLELTHEGPESGVIGTFPDTQVEPGDIIVVHLNANPSSGDAVYSETGSKTEQMATSNYASAWDFVYDKFSCQFSNVVLRINAPNGVTMDGVALARTDLMSSQRPAEFGSKWLKALQLDEQWIPKTCGGLTCSYASVPSAIQVSADWTGARTTMELGVRTISRKNLTDDDTGEDWHITTPSFGFPNPGQ